MAQRRRGSRGFTLVEIMIVIAVIGLLSSVALPTYRTFQLRSRQAERAVITTSIYRGIEDCWMRDGRFPTDWGGGRTFMNLTNWNPSYPPGTTKRAWREVAAAGDDWSRVSLKIDGAVYYSYYGYGYSLGNGVRYDLLYVVGDLDGDRTYDEVQKEWYFQGAGLVQYPGTSPRDATYEWRWPGNDLVF